MVGRRAWGAALTCAVLAGASAPDLRAEDPRPPAAKAPPPKVEPKFEVHLPDLGAVRPLPKASDTRTLLEIEVDAKGRIRFAGAIITLDALEKELVKISSAPRKSGETCVVLRLDRDLPWGASQRLLHLCADPKIRVYKASVAAHPEGAEDEESVGIAPYVEASFLGREERAALVAVPVKLEHDDTEIPVAPADLFPFLKTGHAELDGKKTLFEIEAGPSIPTGEVLAAGDAALRHGAAVVHYRAIRPPLEGDLAKAVAALKPAKGRLVLTVLGQRVLPPKEDAPALPPVDAETKTAWGKVVLESAEREIEIGDGDPPPK